MISMKTIKSPKRAIYPLLFIILSAVVIFNVVRIASQKEQNKVVTYKVEGGWGYRIIQGDRVTVEQPFIPLLPGKTPFPSRKSAGKTGKIVLERLQSQQIPVLTIQDLMELELIK